MTTTIPRTKMWCSPSDLLTAQVELFRRDLYVSASELQAALSSNEVEGRKAIYSEAMIQSIRAEMKKISEYIPIPYIVFLANAEGCVLDLICSSEKLESEMQQAGLCPGVNLGKSVSGLNAVSLSMEMNCMGIVRGEEHTDPAFENWNCVCAPLFVDGSIQGYVDISFGVEQQIEFAIPFVQQLAENVTDKWMNQNIDLQKYRLDMSFGEYKLTAREKDVASLWLSEKSALHISSELGISEGSVRNVVKSIYFKMNVNDRWQFTKKLTH